MLPRKTVQLPLSTTLTSFALVIIITSLGYTLKDPIFSRFAQTFTTNPMLIGLLVSISAMVMIIVSEPVGTVGDITGPKPTLLLGAVLLMSSLLMFYMSKSMYHFMLAGIFTGIGASFLWSSARVIFIDLSTKKTRTEAFAVYDASWGLGSAFGPLLGGGAALALGIRMPFLLGAVLVIISLVLFSRLIPKKEEKKDALKKLFKFRSGGGAITHGVHFIKHADWQLRWGIVAYILIYACWTLLYTYAPLLFKQFNNFEIGLLFFTNVLVFALCCLPSGILSSRFTKKAVLTFGFLLSAVAMWMFALDSTFVFVLATMALLGFGLSMIQPILDAMMANSLKGNSERGLLSGMVLTAASVGSVAGPVLGGFVASISSFETTFVLATVIFLIGGIGSALIFKH